MSGKNEARIQEWVTAQIEARRRNGNRFAGTVSARLGHIGRTTRKERSA